MGLVKKLLAALAALSVASAQDFTQEEIDSGDVLKVLSKQALDAAMARLPDSGEGCTKENVRVRREWQVVPRVEMSTTCGIDGPSRRELPGEMRIKYTDAIQCLMNSDSLYTDVEGAKTAFDDFAVLHYNLTPYVHNSVCPDVRHRGEQRY